MHENFTKKAKKMPQKEISSITRVRKRKENNKIKINHDRIFYLPFLLFSFILNSIINKKEEEELSKIPIFQFFLQKYDIDCI